MATDNPLPALMQSLYGRIEEDFGLANRESKERIKILEQISGMVLGSAFMQAEEHLDEGESKYVEQILEGGGENDSEKVTRAATYIASRVPELGSLLDAAYEEVRALAIKTVENAKEKKFEHADQSAEAVNDLFEMAENGLEEVEVPGLSTLGIGIDLLVDPARFRRSPAERQRRFFKHVAVLSGKALGAAWSGLLLFTIFDALERHHIISLLPKFVREAVPNFYERQSIGGQLLLLVALAAGAVLVGFIVVYLAVRAGASPHLTSLFEVRVGDDELASTVVEPLLRRLFKTGIPKGHLWRFTKNVYRALYIDSGKATSDGMKILDGILEDGNEKGAVAFVKSKIWGYRSAMRSKVEELCKDAARIMERIH